MIEMGLRKAWMMVGVLGITFGWLVEPSTASELPPESSRSFADAFFVSTRAMPDGQRSIEWLGTGIIWLLISASALSLGGTLYFLLSTQSEALIPNQSRDQISRFLASGGYRKAIKISAEDRSFFGTVLHSTLLTAPKGHAAMVVAMEDAADEETARRLRKVDFLNLVGQLAPMAGLFGTVYGMILAFQSIVAAGGNADPVLLAGGIGTALVTTFWGLVVAIPALMGYAVIRNRILNASEVVIADVAALIRPFDPELRKSAVPATKPASNIEVSGDSPKASFSDQAEEFRVDERQPNPQPNSQTARD